MSFTQIGNTEKKQGGEEDEFNFGYIEFAGSMVPLGRVVSYKGEYEN